jgi:hypothetical protein
MGVSEYYGALIAVGGTVLGVGLTGMFGVLLGRQTVNAQKAALDAQLAHATLEAIRTERRAAFADCLDCLERYNLLVVTIDGELERLGELQANPDESEAADTQTRAIDALVELERPLREEWRAALCRVSLLGSAEVEDAGYQLFAQWQSIFNELFEGEVDEGELERRAASPTDGWEVAGNVIDPDEPIRPFRAVSAAELLYLMQKDLGIDGVRVDPALGVPAMGVGGDTEPT